MAVSRLVSCSMVRLGGAGGMWRVSSRLLADWFDEGEVEVEVEREGG